MDEGRIAIGDLSDDPHAAELDDGDDRSLASAGRRRDELADVDVAAGDDAIDRRGDPGPGQGHPRLLEVDAGHAQTLLALAQLGPGREELGLGGPEAGQGPGDAGL